MMLRRGFLKLLGAACVIPLIIIGTIAIRSAWINRDGVCVLVEPYEVVAGTIRMRGGGMFSSATPVPSLYYRGKYSVSGNECREWHYVSMGEYERRMYKQP